MSQLALGLASHSSVSITQLPLGRLPWRRPGLRSACRSSVSNTWLPLGRLPLRQPALASTAFRSATIHQLATDGVGQSWVSCHSSLATLRFLCCCWLALGLADIWLVAIGFRYTWVGCHGWACPWVSCHSLVSNNPVLGCWLEIFWVSLCDS